MSTVNKCDRCKKLDVGKMRNLGLTVGRQDLPYTDPLFKIDLCAGCQEDLKEFYDWTKEQDEI